MAHPRELTRRGRLRRLAALVAATVGVAGSILAVTLASPASAATDLALGKPATADSTQTGHSPSAADDGDAGTRWCAADGSTGHWWQVDLGTTANLTGTQVVWEFARAYGYRVAVSTNGTSWTPVADRTAGTTSTQTSSDAFTAAGRYVRVTVTGLAPGSWASMFTFSVFGTAGTGGTPAPRPYKGVANSACGDLGKLKVAWYYNWGLSPGGCTTPEFVPMIAGKNEKSAAAVTAALNQVAGAGYRTVLGFNEPNKADQSNLTVNQAIALWPALTANPAVRVGSPATSGDGQAWFTDFMTQANAKGLRVDFLALHWYGWNAGSCDATASTLENYVKWAEAIPGNRPIWITEMGCLNQSNPDAATVQRFYSAAVAMLARHPRVERYAWYPWITNHALVDSGGGLTPLGTVFANAPAYR